jgi:hypothetical protein
MKKTLSVTAFVCAALGAAFAQEGADASEAPGASALPVGFSTDYVVNNFQGTRVESGNYTLKYL